MIFYGLTDKVIVTLNREFIGNFQFIPKLPDDGGINLRRGLAQSLPVDSPTNRTFRMALYKLDNLLDLSVFLHQAPPFTSQRFFSSVIICPDRLKNTQICGIAQGVKVGFGHNIFIGYSLGVLSVGR